MADKSFLVLDTNIWVYKTYLLHTAIGASVIYSLNQTGRTLALPEVIEKEIRKHTIKHGGDAVASIKEGYERIAQLMGERDDYRVPSDAELAQRVDTRLMELGGMIYKVDFTFEHARGALHRVMEETPPNSPKNQQFKDSVIWEAILELAREGNNVDFVTEDKGFFKDRNPSLGLAENLRRDVDEVSGSIKVYYELGNYLESIKEERPGLNYAEIAESIDNEIKVTLNRRAEDQGYELGDLVEHNITAYLTEKPNIVAVEFELNYQARGIRRPEAQEEIAAKEVVKGDCSYQITDRKASEIRFECIRVFDLSGVPIPAYGALILTVESATMGMGRRTIPYTLRELLAD